MPKTGKRKYRVTSRRTWLRTYRRTAVESQTNTVVPGCVDIHIYQTHGSAAHALRPALHAYVPGNLGIRLPDL